ncbi:tail fiber domain-containing protein [uncultured Psychroserpens sp.]|uniref:tail fiber domain-containing protein n=1 Tax=uncultured Psychroserpens sp. TaxID=255436 RepID=UPI00262083E3|nr:tail fiber domain-containing protein [uncultured Psychroserpens sp.]
MNFSKKNHELKKNNRTVVSKIKLTIIACLIALTSIAQTGINYKALIKDVNGNVVSNSIIEVQFTLLQGLSMNTVYTETHMPTTDDNGIVILTIGQGTTTGDIRDVEWILGEVFINVQIDTGSGLIDFGTTEFQYVPFAYAAEIAAEAKNVTGLEAINESNGIGWRLIGSNPDNHGNIGEKALDFSESQFPSETLGAIGELSVAFGRNSSSIGYSSFAMGDIATAGGEQSFAFGEQSSSPGDFSVAMGFNNLSSGDYSNAFGRSNLVFGDHSFGSGQSNQISAEYAFAHGRSNLVSSTYGIAMGDDNTVEGYSAIALGSGNESQASYSTTLGLNNLVSGFAALATGTSTIASANYATALGISTIASGISSFAAGNNSEASGDNSMALGYFNESTGSRSVAIGRNSISSGANSVVIGDDSVASGINSIAIGELLESRAANEVVVGFGNTLYNPDSPSSNRAFSVANGSFSFNGTSITLNRRNALTVLRNGNTGIGTDTPQERLHITDGRLRIGSETIEDGGSNILRFNASLIPDQNNVMSLGNSSLRWTGLWATDGTINTSDRREKKDIKTLNYGLNEVLQMNPVSFKWKDRIDQDTKLGLIAQDVLELIPEVVKTHTWEPISEENDTLQKVKLDRLGVYYSDLIPVLINAIKEQNKEIEALKKVLKTQKSLEDRISSLEQKISH